MGQSGGAWGETAWGYGEVASGLISVRRVSRGGSNQGEVVGRSSNDGEVQNDS